MENYEPLNLKLIIQESRRVAPNEPLDCGLYFLGVALTLWGPFAHLVNCAYFAICNSWNFQENDVWIWEIWVASFKRNYNICSQQFINPVTHSHSCYFPLKSIGFFLPFLVPFLLVFYLWYLFWPFKINIAWYLNFLTYIYSNIWDSTPCLMCARHLIF